MPVIAVATHHTASAVVASPLQDESCVYLSSGTWSLTGVESLTPFSDSSALALNITDEGGVDDRYRVLKNIMGLWLLNRITQELAIADLPALLETAATLPPFTSLINPNDERFINPPSMVEAIRQACRERQQPVPQEAAALAHCIVEQALALLDTLPVSMHCWQGDDVAGFEDPSGALTGGIQATGNYPGKATNAQQLRADLEPAVSLIPRPKRLNLHAIYLEAEQPVERNAIQQAHFTRWVAWAREYHLGLDFNPTCFSHPLSADGFTLSHADDRIRLIFIRMIKLLRLRFLPAMLFIVLSI